MLYVNYTSTKLEEKDGGGRMITIFNPEMKYHDRVYSSSHSFLSYEFSLRKEVHRNQAGAAV